MECEVDKVLKDAAAQLGKPESAVNPFIEFFRSNWITNKSDLRNLSDEQWRSVGMPMALENVVRRSLEQTFNRPSEDSETVLGSSSMAQSFPSTPAADNNSNSLEGLLPFADSGAPSSFDITAEISSIVTDPVQSQTHIIACLKLLHQVISNILKKPDDPLKRSLRITNASIANKILIFPAAKRFLFGVGFVEEYGAAADGGRLVMYHVYTSRLIDACTVVANALCALGVDAPPLQSKAFNPFASNITVSEDKLGFKAALDKSALESDEVRNELRRRRNAAHNPSPLSSPPPLDPKIFDISELARQPTALRQLEAAAEEESHDDHISAEDVNIASLLQVCTGGPTFQSRAKTELDTVRRQKTYQLSTLRVLFPDRSVLQLTFEGRTTFRKVYAAVEPFLDESVASAVGGWYLYASPPRRRFKPEETLKQAGLMPTAMVHFTLADRSAHKGGAFLKNPPQQPPPSSSATDNKDNQAPSSGAVVPPCVVPPCVVPPAVDTAAAQCKADCSGPADEPTEKDTSSGVDLLC